MSVEHVGNYAIRSVASSFLLFLFLSCKLSFTTHGCFHHDKIPFFSHLEGKWVVGCEIRQMDGSPLALSRFLLFEKWPLVLFAGWHLMTYIALGFSRGIFS